MRLNSLFVTLAFLGSALPIYSSKAAMPCEAESTVTASGIVKRLAMDTTQTAWAITFNKKTESPCVVGAIILNSKILPFDCKVGNSATAPGRVLFQSGNPLSAQIVARRFGVKRLS